MQLIQELKSFLRGVIDVRTSTDTVKAAESIKNNIYFRGPNVWILVCAIVLASVGLNVNSTAVIIGAMLVSPLMGPIFGVGLGLGTEDTGLIKSAVKNLLIMVVISLMAATIYFLITPLKLANPTELMSRTNPTIYDVMIALFGVLRASSNSPEKRKVRSSPEWLSRQPSCLLFVQPDTVSLQATSHISSERSICSP